MVGRKYRSWWRFVRDCVLSHLSHVRLFATLWTVACQAPLLIGFSRQEYWSGLPCPPPGIFPTQRSNLHLLWLLHCKQILYPLSHLGKNYDHPQNVPPCGFFSPGNFTRFGQWPRLYNEQMESGLFPSGPSLKHTHLNGLVLGFLW